MPIFCKNKKKNAYKCKKQRVFGVGLKLFVGGSVRRVVATIKRTDKTDSNKQKKIN